MTPVSGDRVVAGLECVKKSLTPSIWSVAHESLATKPGQQAGSIR
jgi:hypothetical protein